MRSSAILLVASLLIMACTSESLAQDTAGIGLALKLDGDYVAVAEVLPDGAAAASGAIHAGDRLIAVAQGVGPDVPLKGKKITDVTPLCRGKKGTTIRLTLAPSGKDESQAIVVGLVRGERKELARWGDGAHLKTGTNVPDVPLMPLEGESTGHLADYAGKVVVIEFWATWCGPCQGKMAELQGLPAKHPEWEGKVALLSAAFVTEGDDEGEPLRHVKAKGWGRTHNVRANAEMMKAFHVNSLPTVYVIDQEGNVAGSSNVIDVPSIVNGLLLAPPKP